MITLAAATATIGALSSAIGLADKIYSAYRNYLSDGEVSKVTAELHYETIGMSSDGNQLIHSTDGNVAKSVSREELANLLGPADSQVIEAIETRLDALVARWSEITKDFELVDADQRAKYKIRLGNISKCLIQN